MLTHTEIAEQVAKHGVPEILTLADGTELPNRAGARAFNYYDMEPCQIIIPAGPNDAQPDTSGQLPGGIAWWVKTDTGLLDGSRMCSLEHARQKGWL
jgi:hypothetical protein